MLDAELIERFTTAPEHAYPEFLQRYTPVLLRMIRRFMRDQDEVMEVYTSICERLRSNDFGALRRFRHGSEVAPWLSVVVANACRDRYRKHRALSVPASVLSRLDDFEKLVFKYYYQGSLTHEEIHQVVSTKHGLDCTPYDVSCAVEKIDGLLSERKRWVLLAALSHNRPQYSLEDMVEAGAGPIDPATDTEEGFGQRERVEALNRALLLLPSDDQMLVLLRFEHGLTAVQIARMLRFENPKQVYTRLTTVLQRIRRLLEKEGVN